MPSPRLPSTTSTAVQLSSLGYGSSAACRDDLDSDLTDTQLDDAEEPLPSGTGFLLPGDGGGRGRRRRDTRIRHGNRTQQLQRLSLTARPPGGYSSAGHAARMNHLARGPEEGRECGGCSRRLRSRTVRLLGRQDSWEE